MAVSLHTKPAGAWHRRCNPGHPRNRFADKVAVLSLIASMWTCARVYADTGASTSADGSGTPLFVFSGFGTLGVVHSSEKDADFTSSIFKPNGAGYTHAWSADVDSNFAGQVIADLTPHLSAMLQVLSEQRFDNTYTPYVEWANIKYQFTPDVSVRVGRIVLPSFLFSDSRHVGYANPWVRPPVEVYSLVPVANSDGVDASYRFQTGAVTHTLLGTYGRTMDKEPQGGRSEARRQWVICDTIEYGAAALHIAYQQAHLTIDALNTFFNVFRPFGPQGVAIADRYDQDDKPLTFIGLGGMYNPGEWFVTGEWGTTDLHSVLGKSTAWYASAGYRFGRFTPYVEYAEVTAQGNKSDPGLNLAALPSNLAGPAAGLNASLNSILESAPTQNTTSLGVRWDFAKNIDLKLQYGRIRMGAGSPGTFVNLQPAFRPGSTASTVSATVDFVF